MPAPSLPNPKKIEPNFMVLEIQARYDEKLVLPYKEGIEVLRFLENAKIYSKEYNKDAMVKDLTEGTIKSSSIGAQEYGEAILRTTLLSEEDNSK
jgi:hypothetical protein